MKSRALFWPKFETPVKIHTEKSAGRDVRLRAGNFNLGQKGR